MNDAPAAVQAVGDHVGAERDAILLPLDGRDDLSVFGAHELDDVGGGEFVEGERGRVDSFGGKRLPLRTDWHTASRRL